MSELAPTTTETWTEVDRSADPHIELERLPPAMRHLMPVVPDPVDDALIAVQVAWNTPPSPRIRVQRRKRCPKPIPLRKSLNDTGNGSILDIKAQVTCLVHELGEHLDRTNEMEEVLLNKLLAVMGIGTSEIPTIECDELLLPPTGEAKPLSHLFGSQR
jgi:hypothetical protein